MNVNFGLFPPLDGPLRGKDKRQALADRALRDLEEWKKLFTAENAEAAERRSLRALR
jgi:folate-dependent tRNA-U54 methylase TrmFO/GidA